MDDRDCKITITCEQAQEADGDEVYVIVEQADGRASRRPPDKKRFEMTPGSTAQIQAREPVKVTLYESDALSPDDLLGSAELTPGQDSTHTLESPDARYTVKATWS